MEPTIVVFATSSSGNRSLIIKHSCEKLYSKIDEINKFLVTIYS
jgi:hypothetical protein